MRLDKKKREALEQNGYTFDERTSFWTIKIRNKDYIISNMFARTVSVEKLQETIKEHLSHKPGRKKQDAAG